ncbi:hypothetical protein [Aestuariispira insulae]|uniref:hypothetical protein n=1 Tax=Aestuariispira insulae TaxID=1461337 RepID=UPI0015F269AA|nr:hypothetical protein [Aestuariispira insulae]
MKDPVVLDLFCRDRVIAGGEVSMPDTVQSIPFVPALKAWPVSEDMLAIDPVK